MGLTAAAVERAMKRQEVILRALSGALTWLQAADILGIHPRSLRRWRARYARDQMLGLYDRRQLPSPRKAPVGELQRILRLYQDRYRGFNVGGETNWSEWIGDPASANPARAQLVEGWVKRVIRGINPFEQVGVVFQEFLVFKPHLLDGGCCSFIGVGKVLQCLVVVLGLEELLQLSPRLVEVHPFRVIMRVSPTGMIVTTCPSSRWLAFLILLGIVNRPRAFISATDTFTDSMTQPPISFF